MAIYLTPKSTFQYNVVQLRLQAVLKMELEPFKTSTRGVQLTLARVPRFATFASGCGDAAPWRFQTKRRNASQQRPTDWAR